MAVIRGRHRYLCVWRAPLRVFCALVLAAGAAAGVPGPGGAAAAAERGPRDVSPEYFYASLHPKTARPSSDVLSLAFDHDGPEQPARLTVDVTGIEGVATIPAGADGCKPRKPVFVCSTRLNSRQELRVKPAPGARPGDSGVLRYTLETPGLPTVKGSLTVIAGRPELRVNTAGRVGPKAVGEVFDAPILIRNIGDVPARGVEVYLEGNGDLAPTVRHSNCRYADGGSVALCRLPDAEIAPGKTVRVSPTQRLKTGGDALDARLTYGAWAYRAGLYRGLPPGGSTRGTAPPLTLTEDPGNGAGATFTTTLDELADMEVPVRNTADLQAFGAWVRGDVGTEHRIRIGFRNNGPAEPHTADVRAVFTVPPGAKVVKAPYDPELEEEMFDQECLTKDGGRHYACTRHGQVGKDNFFEFTLRIVDKDDRPGSVAVSMAPYKHADNTPAKDPKSGNDKAPVQLRATGSAPDTASAAPPADGSGPGPMVWVSCAGAVSVAGAALLVIRRRRGSGG
ncbi:hypothetical protein [Streptomyces sporangiiformans]|uniref:hypothetical protein n=1 Tax=Streptomyces sporangiiformans TaxID=2315329 RepID=UPI001F09D970|nr:hypothetical protein [Streptomyces sporangiiformans]